MKSRNSVPLLVILALGLGVSCSSGPDPDGPEAAVQVFIDRLNDRNYDGAKQLYNAEALALVDDPEFGSEQAFREWADGLTREGSISSVTIVGAEVGETEADIEFQILYEDGSTNPGSVSVTLEDGQWKVGLFG